MRKGEAAELKTLAAWTRERAIFTFIRRLSFFKNYIMIRCFTRWHQVRACRLRLLQLCQKGSSWRMQRLCSDASISQHPGCMQASAEPAGLCTACSRWSCCLAPCDFHAHPPSSIASHMSATRGCLQTTRRLLFQRVRARVGSQLIFTRPQFRPALAAVRAQLAAMEAVPVLSLGPPLGGGAWQLADFLELQADVRERKLERCLTDISSTIQKVR